MHEPSASPVTQYLRARRFAFDAHVHAGPQKHGDRFLKYSPEAAIARAAAVGLDALAIANHDELCYNDGLARYAESLDVLLVPAIEATIEGYHVLLLNARREFEGIETFKELESADLSEVAVVAPHPYYPSLKCLRKQVRRRLQLFDALEHSSFYYSRLDFNGKMLRCAEATGLPVIGCSDAHHIETIGRTYTLVAAAEKTIPGIIGAIKSGAVTPVTRPYNMATFTAQFLKILFHLT